MRPLMTSFLALHWAAFFALLGYLCIDGGVDAALELLGTDSAPALAGQDFAAAPAAIGCLVVAALFCWLLVEVCLGHPDRSESADGIVKFAFVAAGLMFSLVLIDGAASGVRGLSGVVLYLTALMACYLAVLGERWTIAYRSGTPRNEAAIALRAMARGAANTSLLGRISGRPDLGKQG